MTTFKPQLTAGYDKTVVNFDFVSSLNTLIIFSSYLLNWQKRAAVNVLAPELTTKSIQEETDLLLNLNFIPDRTETYLEKVVSLQVATVNFYFLILANLTDYPLFTFLLQEHLQHNRLCNQKLVQREGLSPFSQYQFGPPPAASLESEFLPFYQLKQRPREVDLKLKLSLMLGEAVETYLFNFYQNINFFVQDQHLWELQSGFQYQDLNHMLLLNSLTEKTEKRVQLLLAGKEVELFLLSELAKNAETKFQPFLSKKLDILRQQQRELKEQVKQAEKAAYEEIKKAEPLIKRERMSRQKLMQLMQVKVERDRLLKTA